LTSAITQSPTQSGEQAGQGACVNFGGAVVQADTVALVFGDAVQPAGRRFCKA
jgi:UTP-glucose-1-phosphate uridylyltransferase